MRTILKFYVYVYEEHYGKEVLLLCLLFYFQFEIIRANITPYSTQNVVCKVEMILHRFGHLNILYNKVMLSRLLCQDAPSMFQIVSLFIGIGR